MRLQSMGENAAHGSNVSAPGWRGEHRPHVSQQGRVGKALVRSLLLLVRDQPRHSEGGDRGVRAAYAGDHVFVAARLPWQTAVAVMFNSKGEFIDHKEPAASLRIDFTDC